MDYKKINKNSWNQRTEYHIKSDFYDVEGFLSGQSSLDNITLDLIGDISGKSVLHLQCHFGLDTLSLARLGAQVTGMDISDKAIAEANILANKSDIDATFICCDIYDLPLHLNQQFDIVYTSFGVIGWLPDLDKWANIINRFLKPSGQLIFIEFHPVVWMFDDDFTKVSYPYFKADPIVEDIQGTYAALEAPVKLKSITWNHGLGEVLNALIQNGITIHSLREYDYSPYDCFNHTEAVKLNQYRIKHLSSHIPMVYSVQGRKVVN